MANQPAKQRIDSSHASSPPHSFDYSKLDLPLQPWLRKKTDRLRGYVTLSAVVAVKIGLELIKTKERLPNRTFRKWAATELPWSISKVKRFMRIARVFGGSTGVEVEQFSSSALYVLCCPGAPEAARTEAIAMVRDGHTVSHRTARELLELHRPERPVVRTVDIVPPPPAVKLAKGRSGRAKDETSARTDFDPAKDAAVQKRDAESWRNIQEALKQFPTLHIARVDDEELATVTITAFAADVMKPKIVNSAELSLATASLIGSEVRKECCACKVPKLLGLFSFDSQTTDGRNRYCRECEAKRRADAKVKAAKVARASVRGKNASAVGSSAPSTSSVSPSGLSSSEPPLPAA